MLDTLKERKSDHGAEYIRNMLNAVQNNGQDQETTGASLVKNAFQKKRQRNETGENAPPKDSDVTMKPSTSREGDDMHLKAKRSNKEAMELENNILQVRFVNSSNCCCSNVILVLTFPISKRDFNLKF